jgi:peptidyl-prolyl cis-trans isomerase D
MTRPVLVCLTTLTVAACSGFKEAMTAHVDTVASAGSQALSVDRLASLLAHSKAPLQKEVARQVVDVWIDYQLLALAAANDDSLKTKKDLDVSLWAIIGQAKAKKLFDELFKPDTSQNAARYASGDVLSARHILLMPPRGDTAKAAMDSVRKKAEALRAKVTPANFAEMAQQNSQDPGSARNGGDLKVFQKGQMVPEFETALLATPPGSIAPGVIKTQFGYHIIYRPTYAETRATVAEVAGNSQKKQAESTYFAHLDSTGHIVVKPNAAVGAKTVASDVQGHRSDNAVLATSSAGDFTAGRLAQWLSLFPAAQRAQLAQLPDTAIPAIVKNFVRNELVLRAADSAKVTVDSAQLAEITKNYEALITNAWTLLGVDPKQLTDSAKGLTQRERLAAAHVETYMERLLTQAPGTRFVDVPSPIEGLLRSKYESQVNEAGLDRALAKATAERKSVDSTRTAHEPPSAVPLPGMAPATPSGAPASPAPAGPAPATPSGSPSGAAPRGK